MGPSDLSINAVGTISGIFGEKLAMNGITHVIIPLLLATPRDGTGMTILQQHLAANLDSIPKDITTRHE